MRDGGRGLGRRGSIPLSRGVGGGGWRVGGRGGGVGGSGYRDQAAADSMKRKGGELGVGAGFGAVQMGRKEGEGGLRLSGYGKGEEDTMGEGRR